METASPQIAHRLLQRIDLAWVAFFGLVMIGWISLLQVSGSHAMQHQVGWRSTFAMWALMSLVMMSTTAVPVFSALRNILRTGSIAVWWIFVATYFAMWIGFAVLATAIQKILTDFGWVEDHRSALWLSGVLLLIAGAYQFSSLKENCLTQCVAPMTFFMRYWRDGVAGGLKMGIRHGLTCIGCCWALMLLALIGGMSSVLFMALSALVMALEKFPAIGKRVTMPLGVLLLSAGVALLALQFIFGAQSTNHLHN
jgi:predicted metal-binding membrane protein